MFNFSNKNKNKSSRKSNSKQSPKKVEYQEDFNEIILNDLVPEEKRSEFKIEEAQKQTTKKKGGIGLNLGLNKKKSSSNKSSEKQKTSDNKTNNKSSSKDKASNSDKDHPKEKNSGNKKTSSGQKNSKKEKVSTKPVKSKPSQKKKKGSTKSDISQHNELNMDNIQQVENKPVKKTHTKSTGVKRKKHHHKEEVEFDQNIGREVEEYTPIDEDIEVDNNLNFRGSKEQVEDKNRMEDIDNKFENLIWSEDKFPKK
ncbi:MAG: hypothetical protein RRZ84_03950 [Romboutsia sp.]